MRSLRTRQFRDLLADLPAEVRDATRKAYALCVEDPRHPSLHVKRISGDAWSVRVTPNYRAIGFQRDDAIYWHWIGTHAEYDRLVDQLG